jgi:Lysylphosphatidylglycerol synthase TM region
VTDSAESVWRSARHAVELVVTDVATVAPGWAAAGVLLHVLHQVVRTRGWFHIIRAAYPDARDLRARDVTLAYLAGAGLNGVLPARGGDVVKLYLIRRRARGMRWSTLFGTFVPETLFETLVGVGLVAWALTMGFLPVPRAPHELPSIDVSLVIRHPFLAAAGAAGAGLGCLLLYRALRRSGRTLLSRLRAGLAILGRPRDFLRGVVAWQALARLIRLGSLACLMAAFALPVTLATVVLVMAAQGGGRIIPIAPAGAGLRIAMLSYGFVEVTGRAIDVARITAFSFGVGALLFVAGLAISLAILRYELGAAATRRLLRRMRAPVRRPAGGWLPGDPAASTPPARSAF